MAKLFLFLAIIFSNYAAHKLNIMVQIKRDYSKLKPKANFEARPNFNQNAKHLEGLDYGATSYSAADRQHAKQSFGPDVLSEVNQFGVQFASECICSCESGCTSGCPSELKIQLKHINTTKAFSNVEDGRQPGAMKGKIKNSGYSREYIILSRSLCVYIYIYLFILRLHSSLI